jgi:hypothetical protein
VLAALPRSMGRRLWWLGALATWGFFLVVVLPDEACYADVVFLLFLAALWLAVAPPGRPAAAPAASGRRRLPAVVLVVLAAQVVALVAVAPSLAFTPFSPDQAVARAARAAHLQDAIVSGEDFDATAVGAYLDRPSYSVARGAWIRFFVHDDLEARRRARLTTAATVCAAAALAGRLHRPVGAHHPGGPAPPGRRPGHARPARRPVPGDAGRRRCLPARPCGAVAPGRPGLTDA